MAAMNLEPGLAPEGQKASPTKLDTLAGNPRGKPRRLNLGVKDPLMKKAHGKVAENSYNKENVTINASDRILQLTLLAVIPLCAYVAVLFMTLFWFFGMPILVVGIVALVVGVFIAEYLLVDAFIRVKEQKWKKWIGYFGAAAACVGLAAGLHLHYEYMLYYHKYSKMMKYSNVAASQPALQFEDAGSMLFTEGTTLDRTRAVGYRDIRHSKTLCVAPVVDGQMGPTDPITFFAVGVGCCGWRASFTCDDASKPARGGLLMLDPSSLVSSSMEWAVSEAFDFKSFEKAINLQKSVFALSTATNYRFLRWVEDPAKDVDNYRKRGVEAALVSCLGYIVAASGLVAWDVIKENRRQAKMAKEFMEGGHSAASGGPGSFA